MDGLMLLAAIRADLEAGSLDRWDATSVEHMVRSSFLLRAERANVRQAERVWKCRPKRGEVWLLKLDRNGSRSAL